MPRTRRSIAILRPSAIIVIILSPVTFDDVTAAM
jgi:hypothetical protein